MPALLLAALLLPLPWTARAGLPEFGDTILISKSIELPVPEVKSQPVLPLRGLLTVWSQDCSPACGLPSALVKNDPVELDLPLPEKPGEFRSVRLKRSYPAAGGTLEVQADFYALCPPAQDAPAEGCPGRYFSVQVELSGTAAALCTASLNAADFSPFPVLACGAPKAGKRLGVTLHRATLP